MSLYFITTTILIIMNKFFILLLTIVLFSTKGQAQVDSIHFQFQDTLLKAGTTHVFLMKVKEDISETLGFQFCIKFDAQNISFSKIKKYHMPGWSEDNMNIYPLGNPDLIACLVDVIPTPYTGKDLIEFEFNVAKDCRVRDVIQVMPAYKFKPEDSFNYSEMFFENDTYPIATEYLPFAAASRSKLNVVNANVYPNPSNDKIKFDFQSSASNASTLVIYDAFGKIVSTSVLNVRTGNNTVNLDRASFGASGNYLVKVDLGGKVINAKVTIID